MELWLTTSKIVGRIKARLGASVRGLEIDNDAIAKILTDETLPTLSIYFPKFINYIVDTKRDMVNHQKGLFYINTRTQLLGAEIILSMNGMANTAWYDRAFTVSPTEFVIGWLQKEVTDFCTIPYTLQFMPPNKVQVNPNPPESYEHRMALKLKVAHGDFSEFNPGLRRYILELALCDVKLDILGMRSYFANINTGMSEIELNLGTYEEADSKREELLEKFRQNAFLSSNRRKIFVDQ